jgi:hypothetical protein
MYNHSMNKLLKVVLVIVAVSGSVLAYKASQLAPNVELNSAAPAATFTALDDTSIPLADLRGNFVLLDFWSST